LSLEKYKKLMKRTTKQNLSLVRVQTNKESQDLEKQLLMNPSSYNEESEEEMNMSTDPSVSYF